MALVFTKQMGVGVHNEEWVPANLDDIFRLSYTQIGADDNPNKKNDYGLEFKPGAIQFENINPVDDLEQLIGVNFIQNPGTISNGTPLKNRLNPAWYKGEGVLFPESSYNTGDVIFTIPRTRTAAQRGITHILVKAGRATGINDGYTADAMVAAVKNNTYHELMVPASAPYAINVNNPVGRAGYARYNLLFADNVKCGLEVRSNLDGTTDIIAEVNSGSTANYDGTEFISLFAVRGIGG